MHILQDLFADAPLVVQLLGLLQLGFTIWMAVDAYQRHVEVMWYWIILFLQPIGAWVYFFVVKFRSFRFSPIRPVASWESKLSLDELRYRVERTPTLALRFALAEKLMAKDSYAEAIPLLEAVLAVEPEYCAALHALAECRLATGAAEQALPALEKLIRRDRRWSNYLAWRTLIDVHCALARPAEALAACRELEKHLPTLEHKCLLAEHLLHNRLAPEAVQVLDQALRDHQYSPWSMRLRNRRWARDARRLFAEAEKESLRSSK